MPAILVDSNVILDILTEDPRWFAWSSLALDRAGDSGTLVINPIIYAEISIRFGSIEDLEDALRPGLFERASLPWTAAYLAGKSFREYRRRGGTKWSPIPDFYIGAHAAVAGMALLTRDARRYRTYFPRLEVIAPDGGT